MRRIRAAEYLASVFMARMIFTSGRGAPYRYQGIPLMLFTTQKIGGQEMPDEGLRASFEPAPGKSIKTYNSMP